MGPHHIIQTVLACAMVLACGLYWAGRLFPAASRRGWSSMTAILRGVHAPVAMIHYADRRSRARNRTGCGGCSGCADRNCTPGAGPDR